MDNIFFFFPLSYLHISPRCFFRSRGISFFVLLEISQVSSLGFSNLAKHKTVPSSLWLKSYVNIYTTPPTRPSRSFTQYLDSRYHNCTIDIYTDILLCRYAVRTQVGIHIHCIYFIYTPSYIVTIK